MLWNTVQPSPLQHGSLASFVKLKGISLGRATKEELLYEYIVKVRSPTDHFAFAVNCGAIGTIAPMGKLAVADNAWNSLGVWKSEFFWNLIEHPFMVKVLWGCVVYKLTPPKWVAWFNEHGLFSSRQMKKCGTEIFAFSVRGELSLSIKLSVHLSIDWIVFAKRISWFPIFGVSLGVGLLGSAHFSICPSSGWSCLMRPKWGLRLWAKTVTIVLIIQSKRAARYKGPYGPRSDYLWQSVEPEKIQ